jgi:hypothetical protein
MGSEFTQAGYHLGWGPGNKGTTYPAEIVAPEEVRALLWEVFGDVVVRDPTPCVDHPVVSHGVAYQ